MDTDRVQDWAEYLGSPSDWGGWHCERDSEGNWTFSRPYETDGEAATLVVTIGHRPGESNIQHHPADFEDAWRALSALVLPYKERDAVGVVMPGPVASRLVPERKGGE